MLFKALYFSLNIFPGLFYVASFDSFRWDANESVYAYDVVVSETSSFVDIDVPSAALDCLGGCERLRSWTQRRANTPSTPRPPEWNGNPCYAFGNKTMLMDDEIWWLSRSGNAIALHEKHLGSICTYSRLAMPRRPAARPPTGCPTVCVPWQKKLKIF